MICISYRKRSMVSIGELSIHSQPDAAREEEHAAWCERLEKAIARQEAERT